MHPNELKQFRRNTADPRMKQLFEETQIPDGTCFIESLEIDRLDGRSWGYDNHIQASGLLYRNGQTEEYFYDEADVDLKSFFDSHKDCIFISDGNLRIGDELEEMDLSTRLRKINTCEKYFSWFHAPTSINIEMFSIQYEKAKYLLAKRQGVERTSTESIYVAIFNSFGNGFDLLNTFSAELENRFSKECSVSLVNGDTLCFRGLDGQEISDLMEATGADYNYSYESPEAAWNLAEDESSVEETHKTVKRSLSDQVLSASTRASEANFPNETQLKEIINER